MENRSKQHITSNILYKQTKSLKSYLFYPLFYCRFIDRNGNGTLSPLEIKTVMEQISGHGFSDEKLQNLLNVVDKNHDGQVDIREFISVMKRLTD